MVFIKIVWGVGLILGMSYILMILFFLYGWIKIPVLQITEISGSTFISVIIPVRNEEKNIPLLMDNLKRLEYPSHLFEIIIIDDYSTDTTRTLIRDHISESNNFTLITDNNKVPGKKASVKLGIENARGILIVTTDADCIHSPRWLNTIAAFYEKFKPKMIIAPVLMIEERNFFKRFQALEFLSLISSTAGAAGIHHPVMCNGANLAYEKSVFIEFKNIFDNQYISGDDIFFMHEVKRKYSDKIAYLKHRDAIVYTYPENTIKEFIIQRLRWTSKSSGYKDTDILITAFIVWLFNLYIFLLMISSFVNLRYLTVLLVFTIIKLLFDFVFLLKTMVFFKKLRLLGIYLPAQMIYIPYISIIALTGNIFSFSWKNRKG